MQENNRILIIGKVWPEPQSSAAGSRMLQLVDFFASLNYEIHFASTAKKSSYSVIPNSVYKAHSIEMNNSSFDDFIKHLMPTIVLFDRYMTEEQFGWRVKSKCPNALLVLDMEDLHSLRYSREQALKNNESFLPAHLNNSISYREIASVYRCDLSLVISKYELELLQNYFKVDSRILHYLPFMLDIEQDDFTNYRRSFANRKHFMTIGNFLHKPNYNSVIQLKNYIWPKIRKILPNAELHIYGAYTPDSIRQLDDSKTGFLIKGRANNAYEVISQAKVLLAPLQFGAGLKGKLVEAMLCGTPSVTTPIGAEGISTNNEWAGMVTDDYEEFVNESIRLYTDKKKWIKSQNIGYQIIKNNFDKKLYYKDLENKLVQLNDNLESHRKLNFIGSMLEHHSMAATKYMSRWIEEKNRR